jgi:primary-amine oxidase
MVNVADSRAATGTVHPLEPLDASEIERTAAPYFVIPGASKVTWSSPTSPFASPKSTYRCPLTDGTPLSRRGRPSPLACAVVDRPLPPPIAASSRRSSALSRGTWSDRARSPSPCRCPLMRAERVVKEHAGWREALGKRGVTDIENVQIDSWMPGRFGLDIEEGHRLVRCISFVRDQVGDNAYARPIENVIAFVDLNTDEVVALHDYGVVPIPPEKANYDIASVGPLRTDLKPLDIVQPEGPSFEVDGHFVKWQKWSFRVSMHPIDGLVLHTVGYEDGGRVRPILYRAAVAEMVVPYGETSPMHNWKNAFDAGEAGLGRLVNSLELGCDCLGTIHYFDAVMNDARGKARPIKNAICLHEEDYGILWKHYDYDSGNAEVRRSRRLVLSSIHTIGNYEYGFFWYFYQDGTIQMEIKLTGIMMTMAVPPGETEFKHSVLIAPQLAAPHHQHLFNFRLDLSVDGLQNSVYELDVEPVPPGDDNPLGNAFVQKATLIDRESEGARFCDFARGRTWKVVNPEVRNRLGQPVAYALVPGPSQTMLAHPDSSVAKRAAFATRSLWVTRYNRDELHAAGDFPNQHPGGDGLPRYIAQDRPLENQDVVLWYTVGTTHIARPEDWPVMPVEYAGFTLQVRLASSTAARHSTSRLPMGPTATAATMATSTTITMVTTHEARQPCDSASPASGFVGRDS